MLVFIYLAHCLDKRLSLSTKWNGRIQVKSKFHIPYYITSFIQKQLNKLSSMTIIELLSLEKALRQGPSNERDTKKQLHKFQVRIEITKQSLSSPTGDVFILLFNFTRFSYVYQLILVCVKSKFSDHSQSPAGILGILFRVWQAHSSVRNRYF